MAGGRLDLTEDEARGLPSRRYHAPVCCGPAPERDARKRTAPPAYRRGTAGSAAVYRQDQPPLPRAPPAEEPPVKFNNLDQFRAWQDKSVTLLGMSGVGKTRISNILRRHNWFHYSGDYRIGTHYLDEPILDNIKRQAMQIPFLRELLRSDSIHICNNITVDNLKPVSSFLGKIGNPELGGLSLAEFKKRQALHRNAEIAAMKDVPAFIHKAREIYGYRHFVNDAGGSVCELEDDSVINLLAEHTLVLYIRATREDEEELMHRAEQDPKPLYYRESFLDEQLENYLGERGLSYVALVDPDDFVRWVFPRLVRIRTPRYEAIAERFGYTVSTAEIASVRDEPDFLGLLEQVVSRG
jgi:shikimate kinase